MSSSFDDAVAEIYQWVDEQIRQAAPRCEISGRCCRFREYGHRLYITRTEAEKLLLTPRPAEVAWAEFRREQVLNRCPYQVAGRCTARENRPLGCRIYFCDPEFDEAACELTEAALQKLKQVHDQYQQPWEYRDLADFLDEYQQRSGE